MKAATSLNRVYVSLRAAMRALNRRRPNARIEVYSEEGAGEHNEWAVRDRAPVGFITELGPRSFRLAISL